MIWWVLIIGGIAYGVWHLANIPVPDDVEMSGESILRVSLKADAAKASYERDEELLMWSSAVFLGLRLRLARRKLLNRREMRELGRHE